MNKKILKKILLIYIILIFSISCYNSNSMLVNENVAKNEKLELCNDFESCVVLGDEYYNYIYHHFSKETEVEEIYTEESIDITSKLENKNTLEVFKITEDDNLIPYLNNNIKESEKKLALDIFKYVSMIIPKENRKNLLEFEIYNNDAGSSAYVYDAYYNENKKLIAFNLDEEINFKDIFFLETLIHEYGHIFSLDYEEKNELDCSLQDMEINCYKEDSYLKQFYNKFWLKYPKDWELKEKSEDDLKKFYEENKDSFLNSYASNDVYEDFAESFSAFILKYNSEVINAEEEKYKKIAFFYEFPEMVKLRAKILYNISFLL